MANLFNLKGGKLLSFIGKLAQGGFTAEMAEYIDEAPEDVRIQIVKDFATAVQIRKYIHGLFTPPQEQIERALAWGLADPDEAKALKASIPAWPQERLVAVTVVPYLRDTCGEDGGVYRTFNALWSHAASYHPGSSMTRQGGFVPRIKYGGSARHLIGARWEVINLGANQGKCLNAVRMSGEWPSAGVLAAAAFHPSWVRAMNGEDVPYVWIPGYNAGSPECAPLLSFDRAEAMHLLLDFPTADQSHGNTAIPEFYK